MVLTAAVPDETMLVRGFEHQTFRCFDCAITEQRLTFTAGTPSAAKAAAPVPPTVEPEDPSGPIRPSGNGDSRAWTRAVEKLRSHQAEIRQRAEAIRRTDWNNEFNQAWEQLTPPPRPSAPQNGHSNFGRPKDIAEMFARSVRGRLRKAAAISGGPIRAPAPPDPQATQEFQRFWDSLAPGSTPLHLPNEHPCGLNGSSHVLSPLPKSLSLVVIEETAVASPAARAISLLRGSLAP